MSKKIELCVNCGKRKDLIFIDKGLAENNIGSVRCNGCDFELENIPCDFWKPEIKLLKYWNNYRKLLKKEIKRMNQKIEEINKLKYAIGKFNKIKRKSK